ncbi:hypothetical protein EMIHUDRAFT_250103 [Emiliania huxleyi CCMP1516]|uniref:Glycosyl transferase CAP10 domain-containing protein n=2 Tax=Emiliania huxleyi TaxID=2903 RepID=A0A0D3I3P4_EMIH1|nr:hypothetical protein EMIHUDRAFT_250103 [Emiliania huxleyi CCMP1516]EOD05879.1 hypothetical protein EMIHUDRAFT_250103 [Emiliania huxleyi CCMP1516]|eukprot:XP_005758308.1 hypothetical protein EMIHUDRAFT_250103 [Emiliania huxleyi CCMP1516]
MLRVSDVADAWIGRALTTSCSHTERNIKGRDFLVFPNGTYMINNMSRAVSRQSVLRNTSAKFYDTLPLLSSRARERPVVVMDGDRCTPSPQIAIMSCRDASSPNVVVWPMYRMLEQDVARLWPELLSVAVPWSQRRPVVVWRGSLSTGLGRTDGTSRLDVVSALRAHGGSLFDTGLHDLAPHNKTGDGLRSVKFDQYLTAVQQAQRYQMLLILPGNGAASASVWAMASGCTLLMEATQTAVTWTTSLARPWEHFIPVDLANVSDIIRGARFCVDHSEECEHIAMSARRLLVAAYWPAGTAEYAAELAALPAASRTRKAANPQCAPRPELYVPTIGGVANEVKGATELDLLGAGQVQHRAATSDDPGTEAQQVEPLVIGAGWGSTATRALATAMKQFGLTTGHCSHYYNASAGVNCPLSFCSEMHNLLQGRLCKYLAQETKDPALFRVFDGLDAVFDTPVPNFFPYLWRAYGPTARVVLTVRPAAAWFASRSRHHRGSYEQSVAVNDTSLRAADPPDVWQGGVDRDVPLWELLNPACDASAKARQKELNLLRSGGGADSDTVRLAFEAHNALVRSLVPASRLLEIDITALSANESWSRLSRFLRRPVPRDACLAAGCRFPALIKGAGTPLRIAGNSLVTTGTAADDERCRLSRQAGTLGASLQEPM